jgi:hypothetical protein
MDLLGGRRSISALATAVAVFAVALLALFHATPAGAARPFRTALTDDVWFYGSNAWLARAESARTGLGLLELDWASAEPSAPAPGVNPTDPAGPAYSWSEYDAVVREFAGSGISVAFLVTDAPQWAEASGGPAALEGDGAWRPNPTAFEQFATALARRYSGTYPDPLHPGQPLPRVRYFQAWAEANFTVHLAPQWVKSGTTWVPAAPAMYRGLLNAFYAGVKSVHNDNFVITTGFGPYGDPSPGPCANDVIGNGCRTSPALFAREMLCLRGESLQTAACPNPAHFDALAMDPYEVASPTTPAANPDDVSAPDLGKLSRIVAKAVRTGRAVPRGNKQLWVTEFSYDSSPPNPTGVSLTTQARWLDEALYLFWKQGVSTVVWYLLRDQAAKYNPNNYYSGLFYYTGSAKPAFEAFRFPLLVWPTGKAATVWGVSPRTGSVAIQLRRGRSWNTLFRFRISAGGVFSRSISASLRGNFRAVVNGEKSLVWTR